MKRLIVAGMSILAFSAVAASSAQALSTRFEQSHRNVLNKSSERFEKERQNTLDKRSDRFEEAQRSTINKGNDRYNEAQRNQFYK